MSDLLGKTALDRRKIFLNRHEKKIVHNVKEYGFHLNSVFGEDDEPRFTYTTGLWLTKEHPEIILFGLPGEIAHELFWDLFRLIEGGRKFRGNDKCDSVIENFEVTFKETETNRDREYLLSAYWFYQKNSFPVLQLVFPDRNGKFQWEPDFEEEFRHSQPELWA